MIPSLEGRPTKVKEAPSPHEVRLTLLDTNPIFQYLGDKCVGVKYFLFLYKLASTQTKHGLHLPSIHTVYPYGAMQLQ